MPDLLFTDPSLAALYDAFSPRAKRRDFDFYLPMIMDAHSVLDVGCGTGSLLHEARDRGHTGRLCGLDPAPGMLEWARQREDIEWVLGDLETVDWISEFEFVVMTGHAFQALVTDHEIRASLTAVRNALTQNGTFAFETRNPGMREWERWPTQYSGEVTGPDGNVVRSDCEVETPVQGELVHFTHTFTSPAWQEPQVSRSMLRFLGPETLQEFLSEAGLAIENQYGDWDGSSLAGNSPEIVTIARSV